MWWWCWNFAHSFAISLGYFLKVELLIRRCDYFKVLFFMGIAKKKKNALQECCKLTFPVICKGAHWLKYCHCWSVILTFANFAKEKKSQVTVLFFRLLLLVSLNIFCLFSGHFTFLYPPTFLFSLPLMCSSVSYWIIRFISILEINVYLQLMWYVFTLECFLNLDYDSDI